MITPVKQKSRINRVEVFEVHSNLTAEVIEITSEKLELILREHVNCLAKEGAWQTPLGIFFTIILVLLTSNFKNTLWISAETWSAIFIISAGLTLFWLVRSIVTNKKSLTVDQLLNKVKNKN